jgi:hypothetical protein
MEHLPDWQLRQVYFLIFEYRFKLLDLVQLWQSDQVVHEDVNYVIKY